MKINLLSLICFVILLSSCHSTPKDVTYFQDIDKYTQNILSVQKNLLLKERDQLIITVSSPTKNQELVAQFNLPANSYLAPGATAVSQTSNLQTYTIDNEGYIDFPILGRLKLAGLTREEAIASIKNQVSAYVSTPIVDVQITSFQILVLGDVNSPGPIHVRTDRITILEAIAAARDLTIHGLRDNILLIRENEDGREYKRIDLTKSDILSSPDFYLQQNDIIYVEASDTKKRSRRFGASESYQIAIVSAVFTAVSVVVSFLGIILK